MCRSAAEGGRRCSGRSCGAASARARQARSRARRGLEAAHAAGDPDAIAAAEAKYSAVTGDQPPAPPAPKPNAQEKPMPEPEPTVPEPDPTKTGTTEDRVRATWSKLSPKGRDWIRLSAIREQLGNDLPREEVDKAILAMCRTGYVHLSPDSDRKNLKQSDHDSAIRVAGEPNHFLYIEAEDD